LKRAVQLNAVNKIVFNKMDVVRQVQNWSLKNNDGKSDFFEYYSTEEEFKHRIEEFLADAVKDLEIHFSDNPHRI